MAKSERPAKRAKLLDAFSDNDSESDAGVQLKPTDDSNPTGFKINEDYAKRFEHNKKREEKHRLEEKYGNKRGHGELEADEDEDDSSSDETEDDDAELATQDVDEEIFATLKAIKEKDPRVYDTKVTFYKEFNPDALNHKKEEKPMTLHDYHRQNLLARNTGDDEVEEPVQTYQQEQDQLKKELVGSMHAVAQDQDSGKGEDDFMVKKQKQKHDALPAAKPAKILTEKDVKTADKDPETFLSNFMAARAWLPRDGARFQPLESDDSDDDKRADEFEEAYNLRFEDPVKSNEKLQSFARDVGKYGVRRDEKTGRAKAREREKEKKEAERRERDEEKSRLRKLKIEEAEEKVKRIKEAAGLRGQELTLDEWKDVIEGGFDNEKWEQEMKRRFGEDYYAEDDLDIASEAGDAKRKPKKPKWDDDIDIGDIVPDFDTSTKPQITLSDEDENEGDGGAPLLGSKDDEDDECIPGKKKKTKKDRLKEKSEAKRNARKERAKIEEMVDASLPLNHPTLSSASTTKAPLTGFRYRETSPTSFGLSARDILFADDTALNQYAGLKKMAAFRDAEKKQRDKKRFSKKQRLKQWRKETFGSVEEPKGGFEAVLGGDLNAATGANAAVPERNNSEDNGNGKDGARKKKRRTKKVKMAA